MTCFKGRVRAFGAVVITLDISILQVGEREGRLESNQDTSQVQITVGIGLEGCRQG